MYLVSVYFDKHTSDRLLKHIKEIAKVTGNDFMVAHNVPAHMTLCAVDAKKVEDLLPYIRELEGNLKEIDVYFVSVGAFFPYVLHTSPVLDAPLQKMQGVVYEQMSKVENVVMNKFYQAGYWYPHTTLAKKLSKKQMSIAFDYMQEHFTPLKGKIVKIGLAKVNPHKDVWTCDLEKE